MPDRLTDAVVDIATQLRRIADDAADARATTCSAQGRRFDPIRDCIRAAHHTGLDHVDEHGFHWSDTVAVYPVADAPTTTADDAPTALSDADRRSKYGQVLHRWGLLDEVNDPAAAEAFAVTDLLALANAELEQARNDAASSDEAARRAMEQRQDMATERYALQEQRDQLDATVDRVRKLLDETRAALRRAEGDRDAAEERRDELAATLFEVLGHFTRKGHPGTPCLESGWVREDTVKRWRAVLWPPATEEQPPEDTAQCWRKEPHLPHTWTLSPEEGGVDCPGVDQPATEEQPTTTKEN